MAYVRREIQLAQMKSDFVSNVSHELRTPLSLIRMYTETLELGRVTSEDKRMHYYTIISQETDRLTRLINNILNFSRIESGKKTYKPENIEINRLVEQVIDTYRGHIEREHFQVKLELSNDLDMIHADPGAVTEALINLIDNAIKYSAEHKEISVRTYECGNGICLEISDRGIGIGEEHLKHIFDKFYRVPTGAVHNTKGSGLGLSLVRHIVEAHGGTISVKSQPGQGSTFSLVLPKSKKTV
jgi:signal transduction histidine kinase